MFNRRVKQLESLVGIQRITISNLQQQIARRNNECCFRTTELLYKLSHIRKSGHEYHIRVYDLADPGAKFYVEVGGFNPLTMGIICSCKKRFRAHLDDPLQRI